MANAEHLSKVQEGVQDFNTWRIGEKAILDLSVSDLSRLELRGIDFSDANLRGADLRETDLRKANFVHADLSGADLRGADLTEAVLTQATLHNAILDGVIAANAILDQVDLRNASLCNAHFIHARLIGADLSNAKCSGARFFQADLKEAILPKTILHKTHLREADLQGADLNGSDLTDADLQRADLSQVDLTDAILNSANVSEARLTEARLVRTQLAKTHLAFVDLSESLCDSLDLDNIDLNTAVLFGAKITNPKWSFRRAGANWAGELRVPSNLPGHPIQDVVGLPPVLRRSIADAQYLVDFKRRCDRHLTSRILFRLWGLTCDYGQSVIRWALWSLFVVVAFGIIYSRLEFNIAVDRIETVVIKPTTENPNGVSTSSGENSPLVRKQAVSAVTRPRLPTAIYFSVISFTTLGFGDVVPATDSGRLLVGTEVVIGYLMLGGLVSIFANQLARIS